MSRLKKHATPLIITGIILLVWHLVMLLFDYEQLSKGEGWGVVYIFGILFWGGILVAIGLVIKVIVKNKRQALILDSLVLLFIIIQVVWKPL